MTPELEAAVGRYEASSATARAADDAARSEAPDAVSLAVEAWEAVEKAAWEIVEIVESGEGRVFALEARSKAGSARWRACELRKLLPGPEGGGRHKWRRYPSPPHVWPGVATCEICGLTGLVPLSRWGCNDGAEE